MELVDWLTNIVTSGMAWDAIKSGVQITGSWLKEQLAEQKFPAELTQLQLDALAMVLQNAPSSAKSEPSALEDYLKSRHILPIIKNHLQQQNNQINIGGDNSGLVVGGNVEGGIIFK